MQIEKMLQMFKGLRSLLPVDILGFFPFLSEFERGVTVLKHAVSSLESESNCRQSEQNPMSESLCCGRALPNVLSVASERSIYTVGQHCAASTE